MPGAAEWNVSTDVPRALTAQVLAHLGCPIRPPSLRYLNQLVHAAVRRVPFESVTRIIKRHETRRSVDCPRWPEEFWSDALAHGTGGTCFEANLAFLHLLRSLGFAGYLTINDLGGLRRNHTASIISLPQGRYLVDIAIPLHCALRLPLERASRRSTIFHDYMIGLVGPRVFEIERSHHPRRQIFVLRDEPIPLHVYRTALADDYTASGYFLDRVIIIRVVGDKLWRFSSAESPYRLKSFDKNGRAEQPLAYRQLPRALARRFDMTDTKIATALSYLANA